MKNLVITTLLVAASFAASAQSNNQEAYGQSSPLSGSAKSRAEVVTELRAAQAGGLIAFGEISALNAPQESSRLSRAQVKQEARMFRPSGRLPANGEISGG